MREGVNEEVRSGCEMGQMIVSLLHCGMYIT